MRDNNLEHQYESEPFALDGLNLEEAERFEIQAYDHKSTAKHIRRLFNEAANSDTPTIWFCAGNNLLNFDKILDLAVKCECKLTINGLIHERIFDDAYQQLEKNNEHNHFILNVKSVPRPIKMIDFITSKTAYYTPNGILGFDYGDVTYNNPFTANLLIVAFSKIERELKNS